tara:strand:- start:213 stop:503 length:291 start_codon:yes stop_codon:yes gene_type:complete
VPGITLAALGCRGLLPMLLQRVSTTTTELPGIKFKKEKAMPKYTIRQSYLTQDVYKNVEGTDVQDAIDNVVVLTLLPSEVNTEDTETEVELEKDHD